MITYNAIPKILGLVSIFFMVVSTSNSQQWQRVEALPASEISALFSSGDTLIAAGINRIYFSYDGGNTWSESSPIFSVPGFVTGLQYANGRLYVGDLDHGVSSTTNGGQTWQPENTGLSGLGAQDIISLVVRGDQLYAGTAGSGVFVKNLIGNHAWTSYNTGMPWFNIFSLNQLDGNLYAGAGGNATFAVQMPPGNAWVEKPFSTFAGELNVFLDIARQDDVLFGTGSSGIFRSTDQGETWAYYNPGVGFLERALLVVAGNRVIASLSKSSGQSFLKITEDQGASWQNFEPAFPPGSIAYDLVLCNNQLFSARSNGLWRLALTTGVNEPETPVGTLGQNFPNPASGLTHIPVALHQNSAASLSVFDANGILVKELWAGNQAAGNHEIPFDAGSLPAGLYTYRLVTESEIVAKRMVVVR
ncbi:MAG: T9SS type A sorting domain-containing protein [Saprospiraceae bacterium]